MRQKKSAPRDKGALLNLNITTSLTPPSSPLGKGIPLVTHASWAGAIATAAEVLAGMAVDTANAQGVSSRAHRAAVAARRALDTLRWELDLIAVREHAAAPGVTDIYHSMPVFIAAPLEA